MDEMKWVGISGSLRKNSFNTMLLHAAAALLPESVKMEIVSIADIPLYNADIDLPLAAARPEAVQRLRDTLAAADGLVIASPEYNYSLPGVLKNAIDWVSRPPKSPLFHMPVAIMGAATGMWGTSRMQVAFQPIFMFLDMRPVYKPEILIAQAATKFDAEGKLIDEAARQLIKNKLEGLKRLIATMGNMQ